MLIEIVLHIKMSVVNRSTLKIYTSIDTSPLYTPWDFKI